MKWNNNVTPYKIKTRRLTIKCWEPRYAKQLRDLIEESSSSLLPWMPFAKPPLPTVNEEINLIRHFRAQYDLDKDFTLGIFDLDEQVVIGSTGLHTRQGENTLEIGYWIGLKHQKNGYATEVASNLITMAFEFSDIKRIEVNAPGDNIESIKVIQKLGLKKEGVTRLGFVDANNAFHDLEKWSILREEYELSKHKENKIQVFDCIDNRLL